MEITFRDLVTILHGMGFGVLFMLAFSGAIGVLYAAAMVEPTWRSSPDTRRMFRFYLVSMAVLAWLTVLSGSYLVYPWYRAVPPAGTANLDLFPQRRLLASPLTSEWHNLGMEWKEHIAWLTPIAMTMVAYVFIRYGPQLARNVPMRNAVLGFTAVAFAATAIAGVFGAMLNKEAPVRGGTEIILLKGKPGE